MDALVQDYGYASDGESFSIADQNEIWLMELIGKGKTKGAPLACVLAFVFASSSSVLISVFSFTFAYVTVFAKTSACLCLFHV